MATAVKIDENGRLVVDPEEVARRLAKLELSRCRIVACGWFASFFFNAAQRSRAITDWARLCESIAFAEKMTLARTQPAMPELVCEGPDLERAFRLARRSGPVMLSESELLLPAGAGPDFKPERIKARLLETYREGGVSVEPGFESLTDTLAAEFAFLQAMILQESDEREQARFFFGHLRPLAHASAKTLEAARGALPLTPVTGALRRFLLAEEALFRSGFTGEAPSAQPLH